MNFTVVLIFRKKLPQFNSIEEIFFNLHEEFKKHISVTKVEMPCAGAGWKDILSNLKYSRENKSGLTHITGHINYVSLATGRNTILTVHDIGSALQGSFLHKSLIKMFWFWMPALLVKKITVISETSRRELISIIPFAKNKTVVVHNPVNSKLKFAPKVFNSQNPLILHIGTKPNKNLGKTIAALRGIKCRLLVIGTLSEEQLQLLQVHKINYRNIKHVPFAKIKAAYEECDLLSFATLYEGFGMPVIEAQAVGRPVLSSNVSSIPEIAGKGACLVNPGSIKEIRAGLLKIIQDKAYRNELIRNGQENVKRFQIEEIAAQYLQLYKEMANV